MASIVRGIWVLALAVSLTGCAASPTASAPEPSMHDEPPVANVRGRDIKVVKDHGVNSESGHPAPEVLPREPQDLIVEDCDGMPSIPVDDTLSDPERGLWVLSWWDPGTDSNRSLTVLTRSPSCSRHDAVIREMPS